MDEIGLRVSPEFLMKAITLWKRERKPWQRLRLARFAPLR